MTLRQEFLDDYITEENPVRVVDVFVDELDLGALRFEDVDLAATSGLPSGGPDLQQHHGDLQPGKAATAPMGLDELCVRSC